MRFALKIEEINAKGLDASTKEKNTINGAGDSVGNV